MTVEGVEHPPGGARYLIYRKQNQDGPGALVCSGVEENVRFAMEKAEGVVFNRGVDYSGETETIVAGTKHV